MWQTRVRHHLRPVSFIHVITLRGKQIYHLRFTDEERTGRLNTPEFTQWVRGRAGIRIDPWNLPSTAAHTASQGRAHAWSVPLLSAEGTQGRQPSLASVAEAERRAVCWRSHSWEACPRLPALVLSHQAGVLATRSHCRGFTRSPCPRSAGRTKQGTARRRMALWREREARGIPLSALSSLIVPSSSRLWAHRRETTD